MTHPLSPRDRRALGIGGLLLLPGFLWIYLAAPFLGALQDTESLLAAERRLLQQEIAMVRQIDRYPGAFRQGVGRLVDAQERLLAGASSGALSAELTGYLQAKAQRSGVLVSRLEPIPGPEAPAGLRATSLRVVGESDFEGILTFLHSIEQGKTLVHVTQPQIRASQSSAGSTPGVTVLSLELVATGFALPELAPAASAARPRGGEGGR